MQKNPRLRPVLLKKVRRLIATFRTGQGRFYWNVEMVLRLKIVPKLNLCYLAKAQVKKAGMALAQVATSCLPPTIS